MHNRIILFILFFSFIVGCKPTTSADPEESKESFKPKGDLSDLVYNPMRPDGTLDSTYLPIMTFEEAVHDFGTILEGDVVEKEYRFTNTGTAPLLILNASSTCGCTVPKWPEMHILPGKSEVITVKFDAKNKEGAQNKEVTIFANTFPNKNIITIKGNVEKTN